MSPTILSLAKYTSMLNLLKEAMWSEHLHILFLSGETLQPN